MNAPASSPPKSSGDGLGRSFEAARWPIRVAYLAILLMATLTKLEPTLDAGAVVGRAGRMLHPDFVLADVIDAVRNILLFAGWGLVWMATARAGRTVKVLWTAVATGTLISVGVETLQLFSRHRKASVLDVLANGGGAFLGALAFIVAVRWLAAKRNDKSYVGMPAALFAGAYGLVALGESFVPYFRQQHLRVWGGPLERLSFALENFRPFTPYDMWLSESVLFAPAGFFLAVALVEAGLSVRKSSLVAAIVGPALIIGAEIAHGAVSLEIRGGPIATHAVSVALGALCAVWLLPWISANFRGRERPQLLYTVYVAMLLPWFLRPYVPRLSPAAWVNELTGTWWLPMIYATGRMDLFSVLDVTNMFFLFLPLGGLLAAWPLRKSGRLAGLVPGLLLVVILESMQIFVAGRTLALADMLIGMAGIWAGWILIRMAGFPVRGVTLGGGDPG